MALVAAASRSDGEAEICRMLDGRESQVSATGGGLEAIRQIREKITERFAQLVRREQMAASEAASTRAEANQAIKALVESEQRYRYSGETPSELPAQVDRDKVQRVLAKPPVQRIIQRHGGRVWVEGAVGPGTTFYCALSEELLTLDQERDNNTNSGFPSDSKTG